MKKLVICIVSSMLLSLFLACDLVPEEETNPSDSTNPCKLITLGDVIDAQDGSKGNEVGNYAKDISFTCNGETKKFSDLRGDKVILIKFWAKSCPYCIQSLPKFDELYKKYSNKGLFVLSMNLRDPGKDILKLTEDYNFSNAIYSEKYWPEGQQYIPLNILIDKNGIIQFMGANIMPSDEEIEGYLGLR